MWHGSGSDACFRCKLCQTTTTLYAIMLFIQQSVLMHSFFPLQDVIVKRYFINVLKCLSKVDIKAFLDIIYSSINSENQWLSRIAPDTILQVGTDA